MRMYMRLEHGLTCCRCKCVRMPIASCVYTDGDMGMAHCIALRSAVHVCRGGLGDVARHVAIRIGGGSGRRLCMCITRCFDTHHFGGTRRVAAAADVDVHSQATLPWSGAPIASRTMSRRVGQRA
jgi:hypothetical protein